MPDSSVPPTTGADAYVRFWASLLDHARVHTGLHAGVKPATGPRLTAIQGGLRWSYVIEDEAARATLELAWEDAGAREAAFEGLREHRSEIERSCGRRTEWQLEPPEEGRWPSVSLPAADFGIGDAGDWPELRARLVEAMIRLSRACRPFLPGGTGVAARPLPPGLTPNLDSGDAAALAELFDAEMVNAYYVLGEETGYWADYLLRDVRLHGGVETAHRLLAREQPPDSLQKLRKAGRLDASVEACVLRPEYVPLFTDAEREVARERLRAFGYPV